MHMLHEAMRLLGQAVSGQPVNTKELSRLQEMYAEAKAPADIVERAERTYGLGHDVEVDSDAVISDGDDEGTWVSAWVWVADEDEEEEDE